MHMEVISSGDRDPDAEGMEGLSSSRMRLAAAEGDFKTFRSGLPEGIPRKMAMTLFDGVRQSMNVARDERVLEYMGDCTKI